MEHPGIYVYTFVCVHECACVHSCVCAPSDHAETHCH